MRGSQFFRRTEPILLRRSFRTASGFPDFVRSGRDLVMTEFGGARMQLRGALPGFPGVLQRLPGMLLSCQVILFSALLIGTPMGVRGHIVEFRRPLVVFVMRSVVIACGHIYRLTICPDFVWASLASL